MEYYYAGIVWLVAGTYILSKTRTAKINIISVIFWPITLSMED